MTPRTLLSAIGATAIAFAIAIGVAASSVTSQTAPVIASIAAAQTTTASQSVVARFTLAANEDCPIAL
jgi:hypothetical protein